MTLDPYEELGVARDASEALIRRAYRDRAKTAHPDAEGGSDEAFGRLSTALAVLTDPKKRKTYDDTGRIDEKLPDNDRAQALGIVEAQVGRIMNEFIASGFNPRMDPRNTDMVSSIKLAIQTEIRNMKQASEGGEKVIELLRDMALRFTLKDPNVEPSDPIVRGFEAQIRQADKTLADLRNGIRVHELALTIPEAYQFEREEPKEPEIIPGFESVMNGYAWRG